MDGEPRFDLTRFNEECFSRTVTVVPMPANNLSVVFALDPGTGR